MAVLVKFRKRKAFLRRGQWSCADPALEAVLKAAYEEWIRETGGPSLSDPYPEASAAAEIARRVGARVLAHVPTRDAYPYISRRQLQLFPE